MDGLFFKVYIVDALDFKSHKTSMYFKEPTSSSNCLSTRVIEIVLFVVVLVIREDFRIQAIIVNFGE